MTIRESLLAMGYTERPAGTWVKPIGYQIFLYSEKRNEWVNFFKAATGEVMVWETKALSDDDSEFGSYTDQLKYFECFTRTDMSVNMDSNFELKAIDL